MAIFILFATFLTGLITHSSAFNEGCKGYATYMVRLTNMMTPENFGSAIPETGLVFAPIAAITHTNRMSILTVRGKASGAVRTIAETGDISRLMRRSRTLRNRDQGVLDMSSSSGPTLPGMQNNITVEIDCANSFLTVVSMIAPSPDWIVQLNNLNLYDEEEGSFKKEVSGYLIAYDAGTDDGGDFTDPADTSLDIPTVPQENIAPLVEDETDVFGGAFVGEYSIYRV